MVGVQCMDVSEFNQEIMFWRCIENDEMQCIIWLSFYMVHTIDIFLFEGNKLESVILIYDLY